MNMTVADQKWRELNQSSIKEAQNMNWGLYRNIRFEMAEFLKREKRFKLALDMYLEVLYLDQNGPANRESIKNNPELLREYPIFDPEMAFVAPGIIDRVRIMLKKSKTTFNKAKKMFIQHNERIQAGLKTPISPKKAWNKIGPELRRKDKSIAFIF